MARRCPALAGIWCPSSTPTGTRTRTGWQAGPRLRGPSSHTSTSSRSWRSRTRTAGVRSPRRSLLSPRRRRRRCPRPRRCSRGGSNSRCPSPTASPRLTTRRDPRAATPSPGRRTCLTGGPGQPLATHPRRTLSRCPPSWVARRRRRCLRARQRMRVTPSCRCSGSHRRPARKCLRCTRHPPPTSWPCSRSPSSPITVPLFCPPQSGPRRWRTRRDLRRSCSRLSFSPRWWPSRTEARRPRRCRANEARG
mmetsp:Transcript_4765/g.17815  ORF Transcript_4765/g.17815 Transcript_4765/m.17815 type:complete len:250 (+) Transcript_4765:329-1078(+)